MPHFVNSRNNFKVASALPAFLIIPIFVSSATLLLFKKIIDIKFNFDIISKGVVLWCI